MGLEALKRVLGYFRRGMAGPLNWLEYVKQHSNEQLLWLSSLNIRIWKRFVNLMKGWNLLKCDRTSPAPDWSGGNSGSPFILRNIATGGKSNIPVKRFSLPLCAIPMYTSLKPSENILWILIQIPIRIPEKIVVALFCGIVVISGRYSSWGWQTTY